MENIIVLKVGGSTFSTSEENIFNFEEANRIKSLLQKHIEKGIKFILIAGGGYLSRKYQAMLAKQNLSIYDQHYVGTASCVLNATILRGVFGDLAEEKIFALEDFDKNQPIVFSKSILIAGGGNPGPSSDWDAAYLCKHASATSVISLKDIGAVYTSDPDVNPDAKKLPKLTWSEYLNIIGNPENHKPGGSFPVDPLAAEFAKENDLNFRILSGSDFTNLEKAINGDEFDGSIIS
ncbi:MAG: hypothetical protein ABI721_03560 [Candidatus Dojkabacteria bacterium]